jgi:hypothetical protein
MLMITVCLDWNCIVALEEEREYSPDIRQIREWHQQGKVALCMARPSRLENHRLKDRTIYNEQEWTEKLRSVDLENIELRPANGRFLTYPGLEQIIIREILSRLFPSAPFTYQEYAKLKHVELPEQSIFFSFPQSLREELARETPEQRALGRKWNNWKNDALSVYAFATWSTPDDVFVTDDKRVVNKWKVLREPYKIKVKRPADVVIHGEPMRILQENLEEIPGDIIFPGRIMDPYEAEKYLRERLEA